MPMMPGMADAMIGAPLKNAFLPPVATNSMLPVPVLPTESVTVHVWLPESAAFNADADTVADVCPVMKHSPEQVEVHRYVTGPTAPAPTSHVRVTSEATR